jgi:Tfp pilus assembly protein PilF
MPLELDDQRHLTAAEGYLELGLFLDANEELENISAESRSGSEVLAVRAQVYLKLKRWELLQVVVRRMTLTDPGNPRWRLLWAWATRRVDCIAAARLILLTAVEDHPENALMHYNLACYDCQLGELEVSKARLRHAFKLDPRLRVCAIDDEDLKPLWDSLCK